MKAPLAACLLLSASILTSFAENACLSVQNPGTDAYFTVTVTAVSPGGILTPGTYPGWCVDTDTHIDRGTSYTVNIVPTGNAAMLVDKPQNLDLIDWILNQAYVGQPSPSGGNYTYGDVQYAIWRLVANNPGGGGLGSWTQAHVLEIEDAAKTNGEGFAPACGQFRAIILNPILAGSCDLNATGTLTVAQIMIVPVPVGCLGDFVWHDVNRNGLQDTNEPGIAGVPVRLLDCAGNVLTSTTTADGTGSEPLGYYQFGGLLPGCYKVAFGTPPGFTPTLDNQGGDDAKDSDSVGGVSHNVTLAPGESNQTIDAGFYLPATLGDYVWHDLNRDGVQDTNEPGIAGVPVQLLDCAGNVLASTTTADGTGSEPLGYYQFGGLAPGCYKVTFGTPPGFTPTGANQGGDDAKDSDSVGGVSHNVTLVSGDSNQTIDAGFYLPAALGDYVWHDLNRDGVQDTNEPGIAGVPVQLLDCAGNVLASTTTADGTGSEPLGYYQFGGLAPGCYKVTFGTPPGFTPTGANQGGDDAKDSDSVGGVSHNVTLVSGDSNQTIDAGFYQEDLPCVSSTFTFYGNSSLKGTDGNIRTFTVDGVSVRVSAFSRTKGSAGVWAPAYLGQYYGGLGVTDSGEGDGSGNRHTVDNVDRFNFVLFEFSEPVVVNRAYLGYVVNDSDLSIWIGNFSNPYNQHLNLSDAILSSFTHSEENLTDSGNTRWAAFNTNEISGNALLIGAWVGDTSPEDYFKIGKLDICRPASGLAALGNYVWHDVNRDGIQNEPAGAGINGVLVKLLDCAGNELASTVTADDADGNPGYYLFGGLAAGCYQVSFTPPTGFVFTTINASGNAQTDSDADPLTGKTVTINLAAGTTDLSWDAGLYQDCLGSICGLVLRDCNADGSLRGEQGLGGFTVKLKNAGGQQIDDTTTASDGQYCFSGLAPGKYTVIVVPPANYAQTDDPDSYLDHKVQVSLSACENKTGLKFGYTGTAPGVSLVKTGPASAKYGDTITYRFAVTNTGNTCLYGGMSVYDAMLGGEIWHKTPVSPGEGYVFERTYVVKSTDRASLVNTAYAYGDPPGKLAKVTAKSTWTVTLTAAAPQAPTCLQADATNCAVKLQWLPCNGATSYKVKRSKSPNGPYTVIKQGLTSCWFVDATVSNGARYYYVVSALKNGAESEHSNEVCAFPCDALPNPWRVKDIGTPANAGGGNYNSAYRTFTLVGSGADIWNTADEHCFTYQTGSGNCTIVARVTGVENTHGWAKAGIMIRESLNANAEHASVFVTPENGVAFQYRNATGGNSGNTNTAGLAAPCWIKLVRSGSTFTAYRSSNGSNWTSLGSQTISMGTSVYIGLAVTSHEDGTSCLATFDNVTVTP